MWILGHETTLLDSNSTWSGLVKDAKDRECFFKARDDDSLARTMDQFRLIQNSQVTMFRDGTLNASVLQMHNSQVTTVPQYQTRHRL